METGRPIWIRTDSPDLSRSNETTRPMQKEKERGSAGRSAYSPGTGAIQVWVT